MTERFLLKAYLWLIGHGSLELWVEMDPESTFEINGKKEKDWLVMSALGGTVKSYDMWAKYILFYLQSNYLLFQMGKLSPK